MIGEDEYPDAAERLRRSGDKDFYHDTVPWEFIKVTMDLDRPADASEYGRAAAEYRAAVADLQRAEARLARADRRCRTEGAKVEKRLRELAERRPA